MPNVAERAGVAESAAVAEETGRGFRGGAVNAGWQAPPDAERGGSKLVDRMIVFFCASVIFVGISFEHVPAALLQLLPVVSGLAVIIVVRREQFVRIKLSMAVIALLAWMSASYFWSVDPSDTFFTIRIVVPPIVLGYIIGQFTSPRQLLRGLEVAVYPTLIVTVGSLLLLPARRVAPAGDDVAGWRGPMDHKNGLGEFLVLATMCLVLSRQRRWVRILFGSTVAVLILGSDSRTALIVVAIIVMVKVFAGRWGRESTTVGRAAVLGSLMAWTAGLLIVLVFGLSLILSALGRQGNLSGRDSIWEAAWPVVVERPIQGYGFGALWNTREQPTIRINETAGNGTLRYGSSHSSILELLLQLGAVGFVLGLGLLLRTLIRSARMGLSADDPVFLLPFMMVVALSIASVTEAVFPDQFRFLGLLIGVTLPGAVWRRQ